MKKTIKVEVKAYRYNVSKPEDKEQYEELCAYLKGAGYELFDVYEYSTRSKNLIESGEYNIETEFLFNNQFNTKEGVRIFSWKESIFSNWDIKEGHYIVPNTKLKQAQENQSVCGYCGARYEKSPDSLAYCTKCIGSQYLTPEYLHLLYLLPVSGSALRPAEVPPELLEVYKRSSAIGQTGKKRSEIICLAPKDR